MNLYIDQRLFIHNLIIQLKPYVSAERQLYRNQEKTN